jgi:hypothetical protein
MAFSRQSSLVTARKSKNESQGIGKKNVRQLQGHSPPRRGEGDLHQPEAQTAARVI